MHIDPIFTYSDSEIALKVCMNKQTFKFNYRALCYVSQGTKDMDDKWKYNFHFQLKEILFIIKQEKSDFFNQFLVNKRIEILACQSCGYQNIVNSYSTSITNIVRTGSSEQTLKSLLEKQENCKQKVFDECSSCKKRTQLIQMSQLKGNYVHNCMAKLGIIVVKCTISSMIIPGVKKFIGEIQN